MQIVLYLTHELFPAGQHAADELLRNETVYSSQAIPLIFVYAHDCQIGDFIP